MPRSLSVIFRAAAEAPQRSVAAILFVTIEHEELAEPIRVACDKVDYLRDGKTWIGFPFEGTVLSDSEEAPRTRLRIVNVDKEIGRTLRALTAPTTLKIEVISSHNFNLKTKPRAEIGTAVVEYSAAHLRLTNVSITDAEIAGDVSSRDYAQEMYGRRATKDLLPALFY